MALIFFEAIVLRFIIHYSARAQLASILDSSAVISLFSFYIILTYDIKTYSFLHGWYMPQTAHQIQNLHAISMNGLSLVSDYELPPPRPHISI